MKKSQIIVLLLSLFFFSCEEEKRKNVTQEEVEIKDVEVNIDETIFPEVKDISEYKATDFLPTLESEISADKNAIYCVTLLYAWDEIRKIIDSPLLIDEKSKDLLLLNNSQSYLNTLKPEEYSLSCSVEEGVINVGTAFYKSLPFGDKLRSISNGLVFDKVNVAAFGSYGQHNIVDILYYNNDNDFVIKLFPKDYTHEIILVKSEKKQSTMADVYSDLNNKIKTGKIEKQNEKMKWKYKLNETDKLIIPELGFNINNSYPNIKGNILYAGKINYVVSKAEQRTAFILNKEGAEVVSEAVIEITESLEEEEYEKPKPKNLVFDKSFFIALKRVKSDNPYLGLWITNSELMIKE